MACNSIQYLHCLLRCSHPSNQPKIHTCRSFNFHSSNPLFVHFDKKKKNRNSSVLCFSTEGVGIGETNIDPEEIITGEWPENFSLLNYDDLRAHLEPEIFKDKMEPSAFLGEVMSTTIRTATSDQTLEEIDYHFEMVSGLPVINDDFVCIGVISKKDKQRASNGLQSKVHEIMSSPAITLTPDKTVLEAAVLMLKEKLHRIPIVNEGGQVVGMVTRTDIFKALEGLPA
ncbi:hypothetical protein FRX31_015984 [Thalictrum thalictroides]|uniref:CBS domain-containing protein n=1 Tax=Thalictrum thalictroides TaxID=46969 RepID=A0A7J6WCW9_THATH|nr:hypothetical protein FRX31_015984 [Thalictrum thalictroides]